MGAKSLSLAAVYARAVRRAAQICLTPRIPPKRAQPAANGAQRGTGRCHCSCSAEVSDPNGLFKCGEPEAHPTRRRAAHSLAQHELSSARLSRALPYVRQIEPPKVPIFLARPMWVESCLKKKPPECEQPTWLQSHRPDTERSKVQIGAWKGPPPAQHARWQPVWPCSLGRRPQRSGCVAALVSTL